MCLPPSVCMSYLLHPSLLTCSIDHMEEAEARLARLWKRAVGGQLDLEAARRMVKMTVINICSIHQGPKTSGRGTLSSDSRAVCGSDHTIQWLYSGYQLIAWFTMLCKGLHCVAAKNCEHTVLDAQINSQCITR